MSRLPMLGSVMIIPATPVYILACRGYKLLKLIAGYEIVLQIDVLL